jgi:hypothetical protein
MKEVTGEELSIPRHIIDILDPNKEASMIFYQQTLNSSRVLKEAGYQYHVNFVSHCPFYYETEKIKKIQNKIDLVPVAPTSVVFEVIYFNFFGETGLPAFGFRYGCWGKVRNLYNGETILNFDENGVEQNPWIISLLENEFGEL